MQINDANYKALKAFERSPGSIKRRGEAQGLNQTERDTLTRQVRDELTLARQLCGPGHHQFVQGPKSKTFDSSPYIRHSSSTSRSTETWTNPTRNAFVQVRDESTLTDSEGFSLGGARAYDSFGYSNHQQTSYGVETAGYIAGMKIDDQGYCSSATAFKIDKRNPEKSWIQEWNIR